MSSPIPHAQLLSALTSHFPAEVAEGQLLRALRHVGLTEQAEYSPEDVALLGRTFLELASHDLEPSLPALEEIPGPLGL
jgi:hypothetical protein